MLLVMVLRAVGRSGLSVYLRVYGCSVFVVGRIWEVSGWNYILGCIFLVVTWLVILFTLVKLLEWLCLYGLFEESCLLVPLLMS